MHPLSSKTLVENFEEIVLRQNQERLNDLYVQEYKVIKRTNKERNDWIMQIHMKFQPYNDETKEEQLKYFQYIFIID